MISLLNSKDKQIKKRRENKKKLEQEYIQQKYLEKEAVLTKENDIKRKLLKKESIISDLRKLYSLRMAGIYTSEEYNLRKVDILGKVDEIKYDNPEEFLLELLPLKENGILDQQELIKIKERIIK